MQPLERGFSAVNKDSLEKKLLTKRQFRVPASRYIAFWFSRLQPLEEILKKRVPKKIILSSHAGNNSTAVNKIVEVFHPNPYK